MKVSTIYTLFCLSFSLWRWWLKFAIIDYFHLGIDNRQGEIDYCTVTCQYGQLWDRQSKNRNPIDASDNRSTTTSFHTFLGMWLLIHVWITSLASGDTIWWQRSGSTLAQVMAYCLMTPSHYLNQCWLINTKVLWHSPRAFSWEDLKISTNKARIKFEF